MSKAPLPCDAPFMISRQSTPGSRTTLAKLINTSALPADLDQGIIGGPDPNDRAFMHVLLPRFHDTWRMPLDAIEALS